MEFKSELWKDVVNYEDIYQISNLGNIKSIERIIKPPFKSSYIKPGKSINKQKGYHYLQVTLCKNGTQKTYLIHRLVAISFLSNSHNYPCVNHLNGNKQDNRIENLAWCSYSQNEQHSYSVLGKKIKGSALGKFGKDNPKSKPLIQYDLFMNFIKKWDCAAGVERETGILNQNISKCCLGYRKTAGGFIWKY